VAWSNSISGRRVRRLGGLARDATQFVNRECTDIRCLTMQLTRRSAIETELSSCRWDLLVQCCVCHFMSVNNTTNWHTSYLVPFPRYREVLVRFLLSTGGFPSISLQSFGVNPLNLGFRNLAQETRDIVLGCDAKHICNWRGFRAVKEFCKSVKIWRNYRHKRVARFLRHRVETWVLEVMWGDLRALASGDSMNERVLDVLQCVYLRHWKIKI